MAQRHTNGGEGRGRRHKTKLCYKWERGICPHGLRCHFAHGPAELQHAPAAKPHPTYWLPPGAAAAADQTIFAAEMDPSFIVPARLATKSAQLVGAVNDFHFAMVNDSERNEFYRAALAKVLTPESQVLEIGTGSGLLAMLAATIGCRWVVAIEANKHMAELAEQNIKRNGLSHKIKVMTKLSVDLRPGDLPGPPDVLVSELFGTLLLGESALDYIHDARTRLLAPPRESTLRGCPPPRVVPPLGIQFVTLIECPQLETITSVTGWSGLDLSNLNALRDTTTVVFTKQYGFQFNTIPHTRLAPPIPILTIDFEADGPNDLPREQQFQVLMERTGTVHAALLTWEVFGHERCASMSTDPDQTSFQRDMQWGQALQLIEDLEAGDGAVPAPFCVTAGETIHMAVRYAEDRIVMQFQLAHM